MPGIPAERPLGRSPRLSGFFAGLPAYLGGKRRLCPLIFAVIQEFLPRDRWAESCGVPILQPYLEGRAGQPSGPRLKSPVRLRVG